MTLMQKRHRELETTLVRAHEQRDAAIRRLMLTENRLRGLLKAKGRLERSLAKLIPAKLPVSVVEGKLLPEPVAPPAPELNDPVPDLTIPDFLQRKKDAEARDAKALEEIEADKKAKAKAKADKKGSASSRKLGPDAGRMPVMGREALEVIRRVSK